MKIKLLSRDKFAAAINWYQTLNSNIIDELWVHDRWLTDSGTPDPDLLAPMQVYGIRLFDNKLEIPSAMTIVMVSIHHAGDHGVKSWASWPPDKSTVKNGRLIRPSKLDINKIRQPHGGNAHV